MSVPAEEQVSSMIKQNEFVIDKNLCLIIIGKK